MKQPKCVSIIANIDIILSAFSLISVLISLDPALSEKSTTFISVSHETSIFINTAFAICIIYFAVNMLRGFDRARLALLATHAIQILVTFIILKNKLLAIPSIPLFFVYYYFLNRADVLLYFQPSKYNQEQSTKIMQTFEPIKKKRTKVSPIRQLIAIFGFVFSALLLITAQFSISFLGEENALATIILFSGIGGIGLLFSLTLWANDRWKILGIVLIVSSSMSIMSCLTMITMKDSPDDFQLPEQSTFLFDKYDPTLAISISILILFGGFAAIIYQQAIDKRLNNDSERLANK